MKYFYFTTIFIFVLLLSCKKQGTEGKKSLIDLINEAPGTNCTTGGYKVISGIDENNNNILDASEIQATKYICNGENGANGANGNNSLTSLVAEPAGANCSAGGYKLNTGIDINRNNILDANEITGTTYICSETAINEVRIPLDFNGNTSSTTGVTGLAIYNFNKINYAGLDSIVVVANPYAYSSNGGTTSSHAIYELIDMTDNVVLDGSTLTSNQSYDQSHIQTSKNLYKSIPAKPINIGVRIRSEQEGSTAAVLGTSYLVLYPGKK